MAEAMKLAYADRSEFLGDPDFVKVPVKDLISKTYADERRALIDPLVPKPSNEVSPGTIPAEREETTHYSVIDRWGNTVSTTTTLNGSFGSGIVVEGAGFFLNNEMDDFSAKPGAPNMYGVIGKEANAIHPHKRMLSSMTPTIVLRNHQPFLVLGSPGGSTIITTVLEVILNIIDHHMDLLEAVDAPRIHHQWLPDTLRYERSALTQEVQRELVRRGFDLSERQGSQGRVEAIMIDSTKGWYYGASDRRGYGKAAGY